VEDYLVSSARECEERGDAEMDCRVMLVAFVSLVGHSELAPPMFDDLATDLEVNLDPSGGSAVGVPRERPRTRREYLGCVEIVRRCPQETVRRSMVGLAREYYLARGLETHKQDGTVGVGGDIAVLFVGCVCRAQSGPGKRRTP